MLSYLYDVPRKMPFSHTECLVFCFFTLAMCIVVCVLASQPLCQRRLLIASSCVSNTRKWPTRHFVTLLPLLLCLLPLSYLLYLPPLPTGTLSVTLKCWKSNLGYLGVKHSVVVVQDQVLSSPQSLLFPPQKWKETLKYSKSSLWIRPTEVGVSCKSFNPSSSEIIKHHCSEEPVGFFKTSSCRPLFSSAHLFFLIRSSVSSFSLLPRYLLLLLHSASYLSTCLPTWF